MPIIPATTIRVVGHKGFLKGGTWSEDKQEGGFGYHLISRGESARPNEGLAKLFARTPQNNGC